MTQQHPLIKLVNSTSLVSQILVGLVFGILLAMFMPEWAKAAGLLGSLFVGALKAVAPLLVFVLVMSAIIGHKQGQKTNMKPILLLYVLGTFLAAAVPANDALTSGAGACLPCADHYTVAFAHELDSRGDLACCVEAKLRLAFAGVEETR